jgi:hypothetical protein
MLQRRQVIKAVGNQIDTRDPVYMKYPITYFHSITWMLLSVIVTINRTESLQSYETSLSLMMKILLVITY